jgi:hypothetical protein
MDQKTPHKKITRAELYDKFPYLKNLSLNDMIKLISMCFQTNSDSDLIFAIKCYIHSYPDLMKQENLNKIYEE